jgi:hypothetical protein
MTDSAMLERRYQRLLAWYPRAYRREHEQEMLAVLMASAGDCQRRPGLADSVDVLRSAIGMRLRPGTPRSARTVFTAVRLMYVGAAVELCTLITILATLGSLRSTILRRNPGFNAAQWHAFVSAQIVPLIIAAALAVAVWLWMAWANGRGHRWARVVFALFFAVTTGSLLSGIARGSVVYAPADLIAGSALCLVALAAVLLIFSKQSGEYYRQRPAHRHG